MDGQPPRSGSDDGDEESPTVKDAAPRKPTRVTPFLIAETAGIARASDGTLLPADKLAAEVVQLKRLRLDRQNIRDLDGLDCCEGATHLYLQHNIVEHIDDSLLFLRSLEFLSLDHNRITVVSNLSALRALRYLGLAHNLIEEVDTAEIPCTVRFLDLYANPCSLSPDYRHTLTDGLPALLELDQVPVLRADKGAEDADAESAGPPAVPPSDGDESGGSRPVPAAATEALADLCVSRLREGSADVSGELDSVHAKKDAILARAKERRAMMRDVKYIPP